MKKWRYIIIIVALVLTVIVYVMCTKGERKGGFLTAYKAAQTTGALIDVKCKKDAYSGNAKKILLQIEEYKYFDLRSTMEITDNYNKKHIVSCRGREIKTIIEHLAFLMDSGKLKPISWEEN